MITSRVESRMSSRITRQHMTARRPAENAELMLHAYHVHIRDVEKIRRTQVGGQVLLRNLEAHFRRIIVAARQIIDRDDQALHRRKLRRHRAAQVGRKRGNAAFPGQIITEESDLPDVRGHLHKCFRLIPRIAPVCGYGVFTPYTDYSHHLIVRLDPGRAVKGIRIPENQPRILHIT
jgi:hypothetical protein